MIWSENQRKTYKSNLKETLELSIIDINFDIFLQLCDFNTSKNIYRFCIKNLLNKHKYRFQMTQLVL